MCVCDISFDNCVARVAGEGSHFVMLCPFFKAEKEKSERQIERRKIN